MFIDNRIFILQSKLCSWRAQALWNKFDKRANHKCYNRGKACPNTRVSELFLFFTTVECQSIKSNSLSSNIINTFNGSLVSYI